MALNKNDKLYLPLIRKFGITELKLTESNDKYGKLVRCENIGLTYYKRDTNNALNDFMAHYDNAMSNKTINLLKKMSRRDNAHANYLSLREYEVIRVNLIQNGWFGITIRFKDNGEMRNFVETKLSYALCTEDRMTDYVKKDRRYFVAGGLEDKDVDFIFNGVGHSSKKELYTYATSQIINL